MQLFLQDERGRVFGGFAAIDASLAQQGKKLVFAMNAGMFNPDYLPTGLFVADRGRSWPLNTAEGEGNFFLKPNGVFVVSGATARIVEASEYALLGAPVILATQSGPLLVRNGKIHPVFRADSTSRLIRNGVGVPSPGLALFAITDTPVSFHELATLFRDQLNCPDALYLDGTVSSIHAPELNRSDSHTQLGPIIGLTGAARSTSSAIESPP
ncbi:MAG: phosphodiester glycosidase family protein [Kofleriaceae bacterium]